MSLMSATTQPCFPSSGFGRGTIRFDHIEMLQEVKESVEFKSMTARISCLITIVRKHNDSEVSRLMEIVNQLKIERKHLQIFTETGNTTLFRKRMMNFNVIVSHRDTGER